MSKPSDLSKLKINRACDLNSITVLPPLSRRSNLMSQASQVRSQSQQSFSQGMAFSQSQLSQNSFDENLMIDQKFGSQEKDKSSKRILSLTSSGPTKDDSQLHLVRTSNNATRRWGTSSVPDNRLQVSEQIENSIRQMEGSISRLGMILESVQNDVIQVNRIVKEVSVQMEGVCQKNLLHSTSDAIKEDRLKASVDASLKSISEKIAESNEKKINEIVTSISALPKQIESQLVKFHTQVCTIVTNKIEVLENGMKSLKSSHAILIQSPKTNYCNAARRSPRNHMATTAVSQLCETTRYPVSKKQAINPICSQPNPIALHHLAARKDEAPNSSEVKDFRIFIDTDEESDACLPCIPVKKETKDSDYLIEAEEETRRILRKARLRRKRRNSCVILD